MRRSSHLFLSVFITMFLIPTLSHSESINACINNRSGAMRIVVDPAQCKKTERPLSWSTVVGVPGPQGEQGLKSEQGTPGPQGAFPVFYSWVSVVGEPRFFPGRTAVMG
jgi:hypothetical protein